MARIIRQDPTQNYSLCVGTYGYRAPELLHRHAPYDEKVDVWAAGCVMSELYDGSFIMSPHYSLFISENGRYSDGTSIRNLRNLVCDAAALDLFAALFEDDPSKRPSASDALDYSYFVIPPEEDANLQQFLPKEDL
ncbi:unnamed protein product [Hymenolepis diminuta]|uniref:non-specific serine/threonine protein kinase n=1 Tax=Hymenolepis diminuta TaxID=6216 RepID=A0A0R3SZG3_HYMDI|nr:unnamed protein product [Hymenolepis diminuta]